MVAKWQLMHLKERKICNDIICFLFIFVLHQSHLAHQSSSNIQPSLIYYSWIVIIIIIMGLMNQCQRNLQSSSTVISVQTIDYDRNISSVLFIQWYLMGFACAWICMLNACWVTLDLIHSIVLNWQSMFCGIQNQDHIFVFFALSLFQTHYSTKRIRKSILAL